MSEELKAVGRRAFEWMRDTHNACPGATQEKRVWADLSEAEQRAFEQDAQRRPHLYGMNRRTPDAEPVGLSVETQTIIDDAERLANRMGATLVLDPERVAKFDRPYHPQPPQPSPGEAVERLTVLRDQARNGTAVSDPNEWEADELDFILAALSHQTSARVEAEDERDRLRELLTLARPFVADDTEATADIADLIDQALSAHQKGGE